MRLRLKDGFSLIEVMVAMAIMLVSLGALFGMFTVAVGHNANQGEAGTRTTEYAQDKMEQLLALAFSDATSNTTVYPVSTLGGTGLGGNMAANATAGSAVPGTTVTKYFDYLTAKGDLQTTLTSAAGDAFYIRQWSITTDSTAKLKTITVRVAALKSLGPGAPPATILVCFKSKTT
jgi:prepilin-type N-terminal cleavage/methylation domain-containing protein